MDQASCRQWVIHIILETGLKGSPTHWLLCTFWSVRRQVIGTSRHGHLNGRRGSNYGSVVVLMETDALMFRRWKDSTGYYLRSFLNLIQEWVTASSGRGGHKYIHEQILWNVYRRWAQLEVCCECVWMDLSRSPAACFPGLYPNPCIPNLWEVPEPIPGQKEHPLYISKIRHNIIIYDRLK